MASLGDLVYSLIFSVGVRLVGKNRYFDTNAVF